MSFTIKCDKCGNEQQFTSESHKRGEKVDVDVYEWNQRIETIDISCNNLQCQNHIEIKY